MKLPKHPKNWEEKRADADRRARAELPLLPRRAWRPLNIGSDMRAAMDRAARAKLPPVANVVTDDEQNQS